MQIGSIQLYEFEVPPSITFGGRHRLSVHKSASGARIIDTLGPDDSDIQFRGIFSGPQAESRARALDDMRISGAPVWLSWNSFRYRVLVKAVRLDYRTQSWILYQATCLVVDQPGATNLISLAAQAQIAADMVAATAAAAPLGIDLSSLSTMLSGTAVLTVGSVARSEALARISGYQTQITNAVPFPQVIATAPSSSASQFSIAFGTTVANAGLAGSAITAAAYLGRVARTL